MLVNELKQIQVVRPDGQELLLTKWDNDIWSARVFDIAVRGEHIPESEMELRIVTWFGLGYQVRGIPHETWEGWVREQEVHSIEMEVVSDGDSNSDTERT